MAWLTLGGLLYIEQTVLLAIVAGLLAIDDRAGWQSLLAQPVFASVIVGVLIGEPTASLRVGLVLELVWLSILPMRGTRRPDAIVGAVVGTGTTAILLKQTGDPRVLFIVSAGVLVGLVTAEIAGPVTRYLNRFREARLGDFELSENGSIVGSVRKLGIYHALSVTFHGLVAAGAVLIALPISIVVVERLTGAVGGAVVAGSRWWLELLPAFGAAALIQSNWHKHLNRFLVLSGGIVLLLLWIR